MKFFTAGIEHPWSILEASLEHPWSILAASLELELANPFPRIELNGTLIFSPPLCIWPLTTPPVTRNQLEKNNNCEKD